MRSQHGSGSVARPFRFAPVAVRRGSRSRRPSSPPRSTVSTRLVQLDGAPGGRARRRTAHSRGRTRRGRSRRRRSAPRAGSPPAPRTRRGVARRGGTARGSSTRVEISCSAPRAELQALHEPAASSLTRSSRCRARPRGTRRGAPSSRISHFCHSHCAAPLRSNGRRRGARASPIGAVRSGRAGTGRPGDRGAPSASSGSARGSTSSASRNRHERPLPSSQQREEGVGGRARPGSGHPALVGEPVEQLRRSGRRGPRAAAASASSSVQVRRRRRRAKASCPSRSTNHPSRPARASPRLRSRARSGVRQMFVAQPAAASA